MANYLTFANIQDAVMRAIKDDSQAKLDLVKHIINQVYLTEVLYCDDLYPLHWLRAPWTARFHAQKTITDISQANPGVITSVAHGFLGHEIIAIWDVGGMEEINFGYKFPGNIRLYKVDEDTVGVDTFTLTDLWNNAIDTTGFTAYTANGGIYHHGWVISSTAAAVLNNVPEVSYYDGTPLARISWDDLTRNPDTYIDNSTGTPDEYIFYQTFSTSGGANNCIITFPGAIANELAFMMMEIAGQRLELDADVPILPPQFHDVIVSGAIVRLAESAVQVENQVVWPTIYQTQLNALRTANRKWWKDQDKMREAKPYGLV